MGRIFRAHSLARTAAACASLLVLGGCGSGIGFLDPHGPVAATQRDLFLEITAWMMIVVLPAIVLVPFVAWRYRRNGGRAAYRPDWSFSWPLEIAVWVVPIVVVGILSVLILTKARALDPYAPIPSAQPPLEVEVVGLDFKWLFVYPQEGVASVGVLALPVGRPVHFRLTSGTVMQSFWIPALGSQIYAMGGMVTELNLLADRAGVLRGLNTQFNGLGFQDQKFDTLALPPTDYERWMAKARAVDRPLDAQAFSKVAEKGALEDLRTSFRFDPQQGLLFSSAPSDLFERVVAAYDPMSARRHESDQLEGTAHADH